MDNNISKDLEDLSTVIFDAFFNADEVSICKLKKTFSKEDLTNAYKWHLDCVSKDPYNVPLYIAYKKFGETSILFK
jgi:hypothetical protein